MAKTLRVVITATAEQDIRAIRGNIARDKPGAAAKWVAAIRRQIRSLRTMPLRHEVIPEAPEVGVEYRHALHGNYRTIYRVEERTVIIVRVIHGARILDQSMLIGL